ncbi:MAG: NAD(P)-dependent alcohol dehydrogenase [Caldilineaceae bacterium]
MQAMTHNRYGSPDVLQFADIATPTPKDNEVLVRVHAAAVNPADWHLLHGQPFMVRFSSGLRRPKHPVPGSDVAGVVEAVGKDVTRFRPGDAVFGDLSGASRGAFAEYVAAPEDVGDEAHRPDLVQAAAAPMTAVTALQGLRDHGRIQAGQRVLVNGASGGVGSFAVQIARRLGPRSPVAGTSARKLVRSLEADHVIDYKQEDFTQSGQRYDLIFDVVGNRTVAEYRQALTPTGRFVTTAFFGAGVAWSSAQHRREHDDQHDGAARRRRSSRPRRVAGRRKSHTGDRPHLPPPRNRGRPPLRRPRTREGQGCDRDRRAWAVEAGCCMMRRWYVVCNAWCVYQ